MWSEENELNLIYLVANLYDLIANNDQRLHNYLVAHGYMREQVEMKLVMKLMKNMIMTVNGILLKMKDLKMVI